MQQRRGAGGGPMCGGNTHYPNVVDPAYDGGLLSLSEAAAHLESTPCSGCLVGAIASGALGGRGSTLRRVLYQTLTKPPLLGIGSGVSDHSKGKSKLWSSATMVRSPLVVNRDSETLQETVRKIVRWYERATAQPIANRAVYYFDDSRARVRSLTNTGFNARQVSCATRDG
eukprot:CAMPEP_0119368518 /NCGR_PEP_ID=MMETSP1334-20130426/15165_1 /TAXON_ID=127549 /ORGANISM="Calcidiscus leptoporus, Strain RCC1130" /LENGTH=170 /DNA_ID=CAMNT_0007385173 /DNA_START=373 /DNA_END=881 /DNA_ORIENTATION=-